MNYSALDFFSIGIGPSSSHTVAPMRAAASFMLNLPMATKRIQCELYGSLSATGKGHATDRAVILGFLGQCPKTVEIDAIDGLIAQVEQHKSIVSPALGELRFVIAEDLIFNQGAPLPRHPNGMVFRALDENDNVIYEDVMYSVGGGFFVKESEWGQAQPQVVDIPYAFHSADELLGLCQNHNMTIAELMLHNEAAFRAESETRSQLDEIWQAMQACVLRGMNSEGILPGGLNVKRRAHQYHQKLVHAKDANSDPLDVIDWVNLYALAVNEENAAGGRVVTAPTNGAAGIVPAVLHYAVHFKKSPYEDGVHRYFLTAGAIASLYKKNASISGADVGCQGEVGSACSMAAAGLVEYLGGSAAQVECAAEIALEHNLGLTCDPIGGLVQIPCIERNAIASVKAINAARMALNNPHGEHFVSLDKAIKTMKETGRDMMSKYKETSQGGLAVNFVEC